MLSDLHELVCLLGLCMAYLCTDLHELVRLLEVKHGVLTDLHELVLLLELEHGVLPLQQLLLLTQTLLLLPLAPKENTDNDCPFRKYLLRGVNLNKTFYLKLSKRLLSLSHFSEYFFGLQTVYTRIRSKIFTSVYITQNSFLANCVLSILSTCQVVHLFK